jgi:energy-coupling factor transport system permease protein
MSSMAHSGVIGYRRRSTPLHAVRAPVAAAYGGALATGALIVDHPLLLGALGLAVLGAGAAAGVAGQLARAGRRTILPMLLLTVLVNVLVSRGGLTVFARLGGWGVLGQVNLTLEAVIYGLVLGLRLFVVSMACLLVVCTANPDELLYALRRFSPRSALTATLTTRLIPVLGEDARRLAEAQRCRPDGGARGARGRLAVLRATVSGALERSLDVAAVLEMRGYGAGSRTRRARPPRSRHDVAFAAAAAGLLGLALLAALTPAGAFAAYPLVSIALTPGTLLLAVAIPAIALAPFADRRGIDR